MIYSYTGKCLKDDRILAIGISIIIASCALLLTVAVIVLVYIIKRSKRKTVPNDEVSVTIHCCISLNYLSLSLSIAVK